MPSCTFFGHRDCPDTIEPILTRAIVELIVKEGGDFFYVGNQGRFDQLVLRVLRTLKSIEDCPPFEYAVVLAYLPDRQPFYVRYLPGETLYPEGMETVPPRFAVARRNDWMLRHSEYVVAYVLHDWGGAAAAVRRAEKQGKRVWRLKPGKTQ